MDSLASVGDPTLASPYIDVILECLPLVYALLVLVIESEFGLMDLDEVEICVHDLVSLNLTHVGPNPNNYDEVNPTSFDSSPVPSSPHTLTMNHGVFLVVEVHVVVIMVETWVASYLIPMFNAMLISSLDT